MRRRSFLAPLVLGLAACTAPGTDWSRDRSDVFAAYQATMESRGYLRTDRDPADASYTNADLAEHFRRIAFFTYPNDRTHVPKPLTRWEGPVRYAVLGSASDEQQVGTLMTHIALLTGLDIARTPERRANFLVMLLDENERRTVERTLSDHETRTFFNNFMSAIFDCGAIADWSTTEPEIRRALIYLHGGLEGLYRELCFEEEISQSFGLFNDDPTVRPSIFNDDEEFALLTRHDDYLLRILYDPRLRPGMTADEAMPVVHRIVEELRPGK